VNENKNPAPRGDERDNSRTEGISPEIFDRFTGTDDYIVSPEVRDAVNVAISLEKPLLIRGEPGTGKTVLAEAIASGLKKTLITWNVKSTTRAQDGLYVYDTVQRLNDSRFGDGDVSDIRRYIRYGPLGRAFSTLNCVLLIDEEDKADLEFPNDRTLDTRDISLALRQLKRLTRIGAEEELDLEGTISASAQNAGEITLKFHPRRKNSVKLVLMMDVGGSMTPYSELCERLFSAAHQANHFKAFQHYFFHNCPYEFLYSNIELEKRVSTQDVLKQLDDNWLLLIVGDAAMAPSELLSSGGAIDYFHLNRETGLSWLQRIRHRLPRSVWLNPDPPKYWEIPTVRTIGELFEMHELTLDGLAAAVSALRRKSTTPGTV